MPPSLYTIIELVVWSLMNIDIITCIFHTNARGEWNCISRKCISNLADDNAARTSSQAQSQPLPHSNTFFHFSIFSRAPRTYTYRSAFIIISSAAQLFMAAIGSTEIVSASCSLVLFFFSHIAAIALFFSLGKWLDKQVAKLVARCVVHIAFRMESRVERISLYLHNLYNHHHQWIYMYISRQLWKCALTSWSSPLPQRRGPRFQW